MHILHREMSRPIKSDDDEIYGVGEEQEAPNLPFLP